MAAREIPPKELLLQLLRYDPSSGLLYWRERPESMFETAGHTARHTCNKWNSAHAGKPALIRIHNAGYRDGSIFGKAYLAHRVIWKMMTGEEPSQIDHIDGNRSNNRLGNLRAASASKNRRNMARRKDNTSGAVGVRKCRGGWQAYLNIGRKFISCGTHVNIEDAIAARKAAEVEYGFHPNHGRDAVITKEN